MTVAFHQNYSFEGKTSNRLSSILAAAYELEVSGVVEPDGDFHRGWGTSTAAKDTIPNRARA